MKKIILLIFLLFVALLQSFAEGSSGDRKELQGLLEERNQKFGTYTNSLTKHSGFFGNKTKKDILHSNEILIEIVRTDNRIISVLNRVVDFRNFEKTNMNYDLHQRDEELQNLKHAADTLTKQTDSLTLSNKILKSKTTKLQWIVYILSAMLVIMLVFYRRK